MISNPRAVKDRIKNMAQGDSGKVQRLQRHYAMERFLERMSVSRFKDNLVLKGGILVAAIIGLNSRSTMDIDATCKNYPLTLESARSMVEEIVSIDIDDGMTFEVTNVSRIMENADYSGVRVSLNSHLGKMQSKLKIDISTGDAITPAEVAFQYKTMFEDRCLNVWAYPLETVLAEKLQTIITRGIYNTRPRDFYDVHVLRETQQDLDRATLSNALANTCAKRNTPDILNNAESVLNAIETNSDMKHHWERFCAEFDYAHDIQWQDVVSSVRCLTNLMK